MRSIARHMPLFLLLLGVASAAVRSGCRSGLRGRRDGAHQRDGTPSERVGDYLKKHEFASVESRDLSGAEAILENLTVNETDSNLKVLAEAAQQKLARLRSVPDPD